MNSTKEIKFNKETLLKNNSVILYYNGSLINEENNENETNKIYIRYGFGNNWDNCTQKEMSKSDEGYEIELELGDNDSIHLCFANNLDEWDNNDGNNYIFQIKEPNTELLVVKSELPFLKPTGLRKTYLLNKKIKLFFYKVFRKLPRFITGNYRRRLNL